MSAPRIVARAAGSVNGRICGSASGRLAVQGAASARDIAMQGSVDGGGAAVARADSGRQEVGMLVSVGGVPVPLAQLVAVEVDRDLDSAVQSWSFTVDLPTAAGHFGDPLRLLAPAVGIASIDIAGIYRDDAGAVYRYPLITNGVATSSRRAVQRDRSFGRRETFTGGDVGARRDRQLVTKVFPAGGNLFRRDVIQQIFQLAGESMFQLDAAGLMNKEVQLVDASPISVAQDILGVENRRLRWDRHGFLRDTQVAPYGGQPIAAAINEWARLRGDVEVDLDTPGDVITSVVLTSTQQVTKRESSACARTVKTTSVSTMAQYAPRTAAYVQATDCSLSPSGLSAGATGLIEVTRVVTTLEYVCGTLVVETIETYGYRRTERARYQYSVAADAFVCLLGPYLDGDATVGGQERAWQEAREGWRLLSRVVTRHYYDAVGFTGPQGDTADPWFRALSGTATSSEHPGTGFKLGSITESYGWYFLRAALKEQTLPPQSWETIAPRDGVLTDGAGYGGAAAEQFLLVERAVTVLSGTADGYLASFVNYASRYGVRAGSRFWYRNDYASSDEQEVFLLANYQTTSYLPTGESSHNVVFVNFDALAGAVVSSTITKADGAPPAIERIRSDDKAPTSESQLIKAQVDAPELLAEHLLRQVKTSVSYAETGDEIAALARLMIAESCASTLTFETAGADFTFAEGDWIVVRLRDLGVDGPALVKTARWWRDDSVPSETHSAFVCLLLPEVS